MGNIGAVDLLIGVLAYVCVFGVLVWGLFMFMKLIAAKKKERLELARHGVVPPPEAKPSPNKYVSLRNGVLCIGIATGLIAGIIFILYGGYDYYVEFLILCSSTILCLGLSYIVFYLIVKDKNMENEEE
jgi:tellurite resistance protein TehA-like permease